MKKCWFFKAFFALFHRGKLMSLFKKKTLNSTNTSSNSIKKGESPPMELISLKQLSRETKIEILKELGFGVDEEQYVVDNDGNRVVDKYINDEVALDNMLIFPGSTLILDDNPLTITLYLEEFGDEL